MGPPTKWLWSFFSRKCTANTTSQYLVAMPTKAVHHIQNSAPGPPSTIAVATPAILPVPTVAAKVVISAAKGLIWPVLASPCARPFHISTKPRLIFKIGMNFSDSIRNKPLPRIATSMGVPHTRLLMLVIAVVIVGIRKLDGWWLVAGGEKNNDCKQSVLAVGFAAVGL